MTAWRRISAGLLASLFLASPSFGENIENRLNKLEETAAAQQETIERQKKEIDELKGPQAAMGGLFGGAAMTNPYISLIVDTAYYSSNLSQAELDSRTIPGYTDVPQEMHKGFNLNYAEFAFFAPVDPYFNLYATVPVTEDEVELEEAFFVTTSLPAGWQIKGGKFKSGFGRINGQHPHAWDFADAPLNYRAFMGAEGMGGEKGVQVTWLPALPFYLQLGVEALQGENELLFGEDAADGPHAFTVFAKMSVNLGEDGTLLFGPSFVTGKAKNPTVADDTTFTGNTDLFGFELVYKWKPRKDTGFILQSEYLYRKQSGDLRAGEESDPASTVSPLKREQDGIYVQGLYQFGRFRAGLRYDVLELFKDDYILSGEQQDLGKKPWRVTGALEFNPSEFSRIRLQYARDESSRDGRTNNELYLQIQLGIGAHGAHSF